MEHPWNEVLVEQCIISALNCMRDHFIRPGVIVTSEAVVVGRL